MRRGALAWALFAALAAPAAAQVAQNRATAYLHPTDVRDARALWVNPAGLAVLREASVYLEVAVDSPGRDGRLRQVDAGFNARGLSFGYQRDVFDGGSRGHTYRFGLAGASEGLAAGLAVTYYRGAANATGTELGVSYAARPTLAVGGVIMNLGQPEVRGVRQRLTFVPGLTWRPFGPASAFSAHARITPDSVAAYAFGVSWQGTGRVPLGALLRLDTDGELRRGALSIGLTIGGADRAGVVVSTPGDVSGVETVSLFGLSAREPGRRR